MDNIGLEIAQIAAPFVAAIIALAVQHHWMKTAPRREVAAHRSKALIDDERTAIDEFMGKFYPYYQMCLDWHWKDNALDDEEGINAKLKKMSEARKEARNALNRFTTVVSSLWLRIDAEGLMGSTIHLDWAVHAFYREVNMINFKIRMESSISPDQMTRYVNERFELAETNFPFLVKCNNEAIDSEEQFRQHMRSHRLTNQ